MPLSCLTAPHLNDFLLQRKSCHFIKCCWLIELAAADAAVVVERSQRVCDSLSIHKVSGGPQKLPLPRPL